MHEQAIPIPRVTGRMCVHDMRESSGHTVRSVLTGTEMTRVSDSTHDFADATQ